MRLLLWEMMMTSHEKVVINHKLFDELVLLSSKLKTQVGFGISTQEIFDGALKSAIKELQYLVDTGNEIRGNNE